MAKFGSRSLRILSTVDAELQAVCHELIKVYDVSVISGARGEAEQNKLVAEGKSKLRYPRSKHNRNRYNEPGGPSMAVDIVPYPVDWNDTQRFVYMAGLFIGIAHAQGTPIRWGGNWDMDYVIITDQDFDDLPHFELIV